MECNANLIKTQKFGKCIKYLRKLRGRNGAETVSRPVVRKDPGSNPSPDTNPSGLCADF